MHVHSHARGSRYLSCDELSDAFLHGIEAAGALWQCGGRISWYADPEQLKDAVTHLADWGVVLHIADSEVVLLFPRTYIQTHSDAPICELSQHNRQNMRWSFPAETYRHRVVRWLLQQWKLYHSFFFADREYLTSTLQERFWAKCIVMLRKDTARTVTYKTCEYRRKI